MSRRFLMFAALLLPTTVAIASPEPTSLNTLEQKWAECQYQREEQDQQVYCFENLVTLTEQALSKQPGNTQLKTWLAIGNSSLAGAKGGLGALPYVKKARKLLEEVIDQGPDSMDGSAYTTLGSLYYKVPGWPISFGDDDKAEELLKKALELNPDSIDANYFYGDFLAENGHKKKAIIFFTKALKAPARPGRELADKGRRQDIKNKLAELE